MMQLSILYNYCQSLIKIIYIKDTRDKPIKIKLSALQHFNKAKTFDSAQISKKTQKNK